MHITENMNALWLRKRKAKLNPVAIRFYILLGLAIIMVLISLLAPYITPNDPYATDIKFRRLPPSEHFLFGTDGHGRCILSRVLVGARTSIFAALSLVVGTFVVGTMIGCFSGYYGGVIDTIFMRLADILLAFPDIILAIAVAGILGGGLTNAMLALALTGWTQYARLARSNVLAIREETFVQASRLGGNSNMRIIFRHILPNIMGPLVVTASLQIGGMMMGIAGLSFLGLGVQVPQAEWGSMISEGRSYLQIAPWTVLYPGVVMMMTIILFNLLGDALRDLLDPKGQGEIFNKNQDR
ncbi:binding-protein-dependent transport systems inner membrane component [Alkaliphilus metalliredigens QYMF]|uniref:Binding-protein-dependent transport systems inner membrane component n=1 Tax=Alkaliphilus metalliredigens (strain QYMF) TaxID=293826 RepID=A6TMB1_ALKMQ|nr:nickel transporter permease [Alkaliphilus metalliredigens]ABR47329.1 binding-protein-dependent transport systems inner membrane component [Alkaliphilus metalliredigens QYMF]